jgi:hypothetical protein
MAKKRMEHKAPIIVTGCVTTLRIFNSGKGSYSKNKLYGSIKPIPNKV